MEYWNGLRIYDEDSFQRKLTREPCESFDEEIRPTRHREGFLGRGDGGSALLWNQAHDLIDGLELAPRERELLRLRLAGWTHREIASHFGVSHQRINRLLGSIRLRLSDQPGEMEARMTPGRVPHYGWQEVFLASTRR